MPASWRNGRAASVIGTCGVYRRRQRQEGRVPVLTSTRPSSTNNLGPDLWSGSAVLIPRRSPRLPRFRSHPRSHPRNRSRDARPRPERPTRSAGRPAPKAEGRR